MLAVASIGFSKMRNQSLQTSFLCNLPPLAHRSRPDRRISTVEMTNDLASTSLHWQLSHRATNSHT